MEKRNRYISIGMVFFSIWSLLIVSCRPDYTPKPTGYQKIEFPEKKYKQLDKKNVPYTFEYPVYGKINPYKNDTTKKGWLNISFPEYNGTIYLTYYALDDNLAKHTEDARALAYKHAVKAEAIPEIPFRNKEHDVQGILYEIKGNTATSMVFYATDKNHHFIYGSLYFNTTPNKDSLAPVIDFFQKDVVHLVETLKWK